ncbi:MAG: hypothetical protein ACO4AI_04305 [Prochlorothrix sp.]|nr:hypothetical protein [Prochlorothrix sp.]
MASDPERDATGAEGGEGDAIGAAIGVELGSAAGASAPGGGEELAAQPPNSGIQSIQIPQINDARCLIMGFPG